MKKNYFLLAVLTMLVCKTYAQPTKAASTPTNSPSTVISLWGSTYKNVSGVSWFPNWGQSTQIAYPVIDGDTTIAYTNLNYEGVSFANPLDLSNMDSLQFDVWTSSCTSLDIRLINSTNVQTSGAPIQPDVAVTLTVNGWNKVKIAISKFVAAGFNLKVIDQMSFTTLTPASGASIYLENIYFSSNVQIPTLSGFLVPANVLVGSSPFVLIAPTSNSTGSFTYASSNTSVATIAGNLVTIIGAGSTVITANQSAAGSYASGSISATLVVSYAPPTTGAPVPTVPASNVISLWGNHYINIGGINWFPNWGQSTGLNLLNVGGDTTLEYSNLNYEGVQLTDSIDVSKADSMHLDIWTPDCTSIGINLINSALVTGSAAIDVADTIMLTKAGWNSINIPMTAFAGVKLKEVDQVMFTSALPPTGGVIYLENIYFWSNTPLPVNIASFKAVKDGNTTILAWETVSEKNIKGFEVERSNDGSNWVSIKFVNAKGNSSSVNTYNFKDNEPLSGTNYYRLAETDLNGKVTYSVIVSVNFSNNGTGFSYYPNPVKERLTVSLQTIESHNATLSLVGLDGKTVKSFQLNSGNSNSSISFDLSNIAKGIYMLTLKDGDTVSTSKVLVD